MIKKLTAIILSAVLMLSSVPAAFAAAVEDGAQTYETEIGFLSELGILPDEFLPDSPMTRGTFAKMVTDLVYQETDVSATHETSFTDLQYGSDYYNAVAVLEGLNVVKGNGANAFNPDKQITLQDALVISLKLMGYEPYVAVNGGYPAGYLYTGGITGLTRDIGAVSGLDMKTAAKLVYNMLFVSHVSIEAIEADGVKLEIDYTKNYLTSHLNIVRHNACLINDGMVSYDNTVLLDNQVILEDLDSGEQITASCTDAEIGSYFGCYLDAYVKYDKTTGYAELVYCAVKSNVTVRTINAADIENTSLTAIEYQDNPEASSLRKASISESNPAYFRNGIRLTQATAADLKPAFGEVKLIDNNGDSKAEVVIINDIKSNIIVNSVSADGRSVICKDDPVNSLDLSSESVVYRAYKDGVTVDITDVAKDSVISVAPAEITKSGYQMYFLYVSDKRAEGLLEATDEGDRRLYIGGAEYELSDLYYSGHDTVFRTLSAGVNITVYLDYLGQIAYIEGIKASNINYAYLLNVTQKNTMDDVRITLYSKYGAFSNHIVSENIVIDGKQLDGRSLSGASASMLAEVTELLNLRPDGAVHIPTAAEAAENNKTYTAIAPRLAIIKVNTNGEIYYIDTDNKTYDDDEIEASDPYTLSSGKRYYRTERLYFSTALDYATPDGTFLVDKDTLVLQVPDIDRYGMASTFSTRNINLFELPLSDLSGYKLISYNEMNTYQRYDMQPYNIDPETGVADLLLLRGYNDYGVSATDYSQASAFVVFKRLTSYYDPDNADKVLYKLYYVAQDGTEGSVIVDKDQLHINYANIIFGGTYFDASYNDVSVEKLGAGDIIFFSEKNGILQNIGRLMNMSNINDMYVTTQTAAQTGRPYENVYGPASNNTIDIPYDTRRATAFISYGQTYFFSLAAAESLNGTVVKCALPYTSSTSQPTWVGTFNDYYNNGTDCLIKYVPFDAAAGKILVVEETKCNSLGGGDCQLQIRAGSLEDLKAAEGFAEDGFRKSSKIYFYSQAGIARNAVIFNLDENHDR